jgi:hypothetical protein
MEKVAKTFDKPKKVKVSSSNLNAKVHQPPSKLLQYLKQTIFQPKNSPGPLKNSPK